MNYCSLCHHWLLTATYNKGVINKKGVWMTSSPLLPIEWLLLFFNELLAISSHRDPFGEKRELPFASHINDTVCTVLYYH